MKSGVGAVGSPNSIPNQFDVVRTDSPSLCAMMVNGELIPVPIGFIRKSEYIKLTEFVKKVVTLHIEAIKCL